MKWKMHTVGISRANAPYSLAIGVNNGYGVLGRRIGDLPRKGTEIYL